MFAIKVNATGRYLANPNREGEALVFDRLKKAQDYMSDRMAEEDADQCTIVDLNDLEESLA